MVGAGSAPGALRIVYFGTPSFAVPTLEALLASQHEVVAVVTQPDRPRGRGQRVTDAPVKAVAAAHGLPVLQPGRANDPEFVDAMEALAPDLGVVAAYGRILPQRLLDVPRLGMLNVHASLLPAWRGAAPVHRAVMAGDTITGVTIMRVVLALDAGPMVSSRARPIGPDETSAEVERDLARHGAGLLVAAVDDLAAGRATETPQDDSRATYAARLTRDDGAIDWSRPAADLHNQVRGLHPWPHAFSFLDGLRYLIHRTAVVDDPPAGDAGAVVQAAGDAFVVGTGGTMSLRILEIQPEGKRVLRAREFLAGHRIAPGARFAAAPTRG